MEAQIAARLMADMFDDGSVFLASFVTLRHLKTRVEVARRSKLRMLSSDSNRHRVGFGRKRTS